jgi:hypothetical protein
MDFGNFSKQFLSIFILKYKIKSIQYLIKKSLLLKFGSE